MSNVSERLIGLVEKQTGKTYDQLDAATQFDALGIDSFDFIELLFLIEDEFGISIDYRANDFSNRIKTVGDLVNVVEELVAGRSDAPDVTIIQATAV